MTLTEAIDIRRSRRKYLDIPVEPEKIERLRLLAHDFSKIDGIRIELIVDNGDAFKGLLRSYGMFSGVKNYAVLIGSLKDFLAIEKLGYYGELFMLNAVTMGLGTCWVAGTFSLKHCPVKFSGEEMVYCTITFGYANEQFSKREKLVYSLTHRKTKTIEEMMEADAPVPGWFMQGMNAVQKAPSAVNRQPIMFSYLEGKTRAGIKNRNDANSILDMGIAKLHFELGAAKSPEALNGKWNFGNYEEFILNGGACA